MSKRRKSRPPRFASPKKGEVFSPDPAPQATIHDAARASTRRGAIQWSTLDTKDEVTSYSRSKLIRSSRWLFANVGFVKGLVKNSAMLVGWKTAHAQTDDAEWNKERDRRFQNKNTTRNTFDVSSKFDYKTAQRMLLTRSFIDGDILVVFSKTETGAGRCAFYESHQLATPDGADPDQWDEGVRVNKQGKHLAYGIKSGSTVKVIPASSCLLFGNFDSVGHTRPHPPLSHAITHSLDITETRGFLKLGIKNSSLFGVVSEQSSGANPNRTVGGMEAAIPLPGKASTKEIGNGQKIKTAEVFDGGQIPETRPGEKLTVLTDGRPHPNQMAFEETLQRDVAQGWGLPYEVALSMVKLTGPAVRFVMAYAEQWIEDRQFQLDEFCRRFWVFDTACEIEAGRLPQPSDPNWMEKLKLTKRRSLTIDRGREGKQRLDELESGASTLADFCEENSGDDWRDHVDQIIEEHAYKVERCQSQGFTVAEVFKPRQGTAVVATEDDSTNSTPEEE
jgi:capsid protein